MELTDRLREWLGRDGAEFFGRLKRDYGSLHVVIPDEVIPHPVHLREGMTVRNWLRGQPECKDWDDHKLDEEWAPLVEKALGI